MVISTNFVLVEAIPGKNWQWQLKFYTARYPTVELNVVQNFRALHQETNSGGPYSYLKVSSKYCNLLDNLELKMNK